MTEVPIIKQPVHWFSEQINVLVSKSMGPPSWKSYMGQNLKQILPRKRQILIIKFKPYHNSKLNLCGTKMGNSAYTEP